MYDMLDFLLFKDRASKNLGAYDVFQAQDGSGFGKRYRLKTPAGDTWDISLFDEKFIYDWITEVGFGTPRDYKKFIQNHKDGNDPLLKDGVKMFDRFIAEDINQLRYFTPKSQTVFRIFKNCQWDGVKHDVGDILHTLSGPFYIDHGEDVGKVLTMKHRYFWNGANGKYQFCEENDYGLGMGWIRWMLINMVTGKISNESLHNKIFNGGSPAVNFPCF